LNVRINTKSHSSYSIEKYIADYLLYLGLSPDRPKYMWYKPVKSKRNNLPENKPKKVWFS